MASLDHLGPEHSALLVDASADARATPAVMQAIQRDPLDNAGSGAEDTRPEGVLSRAAATRSLHVVVMDDQPTPSSRCEPELHSLAQQILAREQRAFGGCICIRLFSGCV